MDRDNKLVEGALGLWKTLGGEKKRRSQQWKGAFSPCTG